MALGWMRSHAKIAGIERARIIIFDTDNRVLLVRSWVGTQLWELPGGAIKKNERPLDAALREAYEEVGLTLAIQTCEPLGIFRGTHIFAVKVADVPQPTLRTSWEITRYQWCRKVDIPENSDVFVTWAVRTVSNW